MPRARIDLQSSSSSRSVHDTVVSIRGYLHITVCQFAFTRLPVFCLPLASLASWKDQSGSTMHDMALDQQYCLACPECYLS